MTRFIVGIGSNEHPQENIERAQQSLTALFSNIWFSTPQQTEPVGMKRNKAPFLNQLAILDTDMCLDTLTNLLKNLERKAGRTPEEKAQEIIRLDLDVLCAGQETLKPEDLGRTYFRKMLKEYKDSQ